GDQRVPVDLEDVLVGQAFRSRAGRDQRIDRHGLRGHGGGRGGGCGLRGGRTPPVSEGGGRGGGGGGGGGGRARRAPVWRGRRRVVARAHRRVLLLQALLVGDRLLLHVFDVERPPQAIVVVERVGCGFAADDAAQHRGERERVVNAEIQSQPAERVVHVRG